MYCNKYLHSVAVATKNCPHCRVAELENNLQQICNGIKENIQEPDYYKMGFDVCQSGNSTRVSHRLLPDG